MEGKWSMVLKEQKGAFWGWRVKLSFWAFCPKSSPTVRLLHSCLCCASICERAARDARHGVGRLVAVQHDGQFELRQLLCRAPDEHARFRINRLITTILMRLGAEVIRRYLEPQYAPQVVLRVHRFGAAHRQQVGGTAQHLIHHHCDCWRGVRSTFWWEEIHCHHDWARNKADQRVRSTFRREEVLSSMKIIAQSTGTKWATVSGQSSTRVRSGSPIMMATRVHERTTSCTHQMWTLGPMHTCTSCPILRTRRRQAIPTCFGLKARDSLSHLHLQDGKMQRFDAGQLSSYIVTVENTCWIHEFKMFHFQPCVSDYPSFCRYWSHNVLIWRRILQIQPSFFAEAAVSPFESIGQGFNFVWRPYRMSQVKSSQVKVVPLSRVQVETQHAAFPADLAYSSLVNIILVDFPSISHQLRPHVLQSLLGTSSRSLSSSPSSSWGIPVCGSENVLFQSLPDLPLSALATLRPLSLSQGLARTSTSLSCVVFSWTNLVSVPMLLLPWRHTSSWFWIAYQDHSRLLSRTVHQRIQLRERRTRFLRCSARVCLAVVTSSQWWIHQSSWRLMMSTSSTSCLLPSLRQWILRSWPSHLSCGISLAPSNTATRRCVSACTPIAAASSSQRGLSQAFRWSWTGVFWLFCTSISIVDTMMLSKCSCGHFHTLSAVCRRLHRVFSTMFSDAVPHLGCLVPCCCWDWIVNVECDGCLGFGVFLDLWICLSLFELNFIHHFCNQVFKVFRCCSLSVHCFLPMHLHAWMNAILTLEVLTSHSNQPA